MYHDKRFQYDSTFCLIAFNHEQIKNSGTGGYLLTKRKDIESVSKRILNLDTQVLTQLIERLQEGTKKAELTEDEKACYKILNDVDYVDSHVEGSITSRKQMRSEIWSLMAYLGAPSWFITFTPADVDHPFAMYFALNHEVISPDFQTHKDRIRFIAKNPVAGARFFRFMVQLFIKHVLGVDSGHNGLYGKTAGYYGTVEQQGRLTLHMHMLVWIKNALSPQQIREKILDPNSDFQKRIVEYIEGVRIGEFMNTDMSQMQAKFGETDEIIKDGIIKEELPPNLKASQNRDSPPVAKPLKPEKFIPHAQILPTPVPPTCDSKCNKCAQCLRNVDWWKRYETIVNDLAFHINKHSCKGTGCQITTKIGKKKVKQCKARFPRPVFPATIVNPETGYLYQKKGEAWLNWFSPPVTYLMRCNTDVTCLLSGTAVKSVIAYVTDYITKSPLKTHVMFQAIQDTFKRNPDLLTSNIDKQIKAKKVITKVVNALTGKSEIGAPMACMYLLKHPDHYTSHRFVRFYWTIFMHEIERVWSVPLETKNHDKDDDEEDINDISNTLVDLDIQEFSNDHVRLVKKEERYYGVSAVEDYRFRPKECENLCLYDWVRLARKERIPKSVVEKLAKGDEFQVQAIIDHRWIQKNRVQFLVSWTAGDQTWESYTTCSHLSALDTYLRRMGVSHWRDLIHKSQSELMNDQVKTEAFEDDELDIENINERDNSGDFKVEDDTLNTLDIDKGLTYDDIVKQDDTESTNEDEVQTEGWLFFDSNHPQSKTHRILILPEKQFRVPDFKGRNLPRRDKGNREEYCMAMMMLFRPWRSGLELKSTRATWDETFQENKFSERDCRVMDNFHLRYECNDARDDFAAQRKMGMFVNNDLPPGMSDTALEELDDSNFFTSDDFADMDLEDIEAEALEYSQLDKRALQIQQKRDEAYRILVSAGALDEVETKRIDFVPFYGEEYEGDEWHQLLVDKKEEELELRRLQAKNAKQKEFDIIDGVAVMKHADEVRIIDQSFYYKQTFEPASHEDKKQIDSIVDKFTLNDAQERAFRIIANHATLKNPEQLKMYLGGMAGTGKSQVIKALTHFFASRNEEYRFICTAPTGSAAALINGSTYHSILGFSHFTEHENSSSNMAEVGQTLSNVDYLFLDEVSMLDCHGLFKICKRMSEALMCPGEPFGGINVILSGDFAQLPPPGSNFSLYSGDIESTVHTTNSVYRQECAIGKALWHQFVTVVILRENMRQRNQSKEDQAFRTCLENMRYKSCTDNDISLLNQRVACNMKDRPYLTDPNFRNVSAIVRFNAHRDLFNEQGSRRFAQETDQALQRFYSLDRWRSIDEHGKLKRLPKRQVNDPLRSGNRIPDAIQKELWALPPLSTDNHVGTLEICLGLPVMIKKNIATECGVTNGAEGIVVGWKTRKIDSTHEGLDTVFVKLTAAPRPIKLPGLDENVVPIQHLSMSIKVRMNNGDMRSINRDQIPIIPNFAMTDFNSQGRTRPFNVLDPQNCTTAQSMYTCLSRSSKFAGTVLLQGFDPKKIQGGISGFLRQEFRELEFLDEITEFKYKDTLPKHIMGVTRGYLIYLYRKWKTPTYIPRRMAHSLQWKNEIEYANSDPAQESNWVDGIKLVDRKNKKITQPTKKSVKPPNSDPSTWRQAKGSRPLAFVPDVSLIDHKDNIKRTIDIDGNGISSKKKLKLANNASKKSNWSPRGLAWSNDSCAYDSLFVILYNWYVTNQTDTIHVLLHSASSMLNLVVQLDRVRDKLCTFESARDLVRLSLNKIDSDKFPLHGTRGTSVTELAESLLTENNSFALWESTCLGCGKTRKLNKLKFILWYCSRQAWNNTTQRIGKYKIVSPETWIDLLCTSYNYSFCNQCGEETVARLHFITSPCYIPIWADEKIKIDWKLHIKLGEQMYQLCGLVYFQPKRTHFVCRILHIDGSIWYHDGLETKAQCFYEGNIVSKKRGFFFKAPKGGVCRFGLYIITSQIKEEQDRQT